MVIIEIRFLFYITICCFDLETSIIRSILSLSSILSISFSESTPESDFERLSELNLALHSKSTKVLIQIVQWSPVLAAILSKNERKRAEICYILS